MDYGASFGAASPPAPFYVAILQILFQMGCLIGALLTINFVIESFSDGGGNYSFSFSAEPKQQKIIEITDLPPLTKGMISDNNPLSVIVVAMNKEAMAKCLPLCEKYKKDKLIFSKAVQQSNCDNDDDILKESSGIEYDMIAIKECGKLYSGIIFDDLIAEKIKKSDGNPNGPESFHLRDDVLDAWLLRLLCGVTPWIKGSYEKFADLK